MFNTCKVCGEVRSHAYMCPWASSSDEITNAAEGLAFELQQIISNLGNAQMTEHFKECVERIDKTLAQIQPGDPNGKE